MMSSGRYKHYSEHIMRCMLEEHHDGITIGRRIKTNLWVADETPLPRTSKDNRISERFVYLGSLVNIKGSSVQGIRRIWKSRYSGLKLKFGLCRSALSPHALHLHMSVLHPTGRQVTIFTVINNILDMDQSYFNAVFFFGRFGQITLGQDYKRFFEHVSVLNSQSVLRNDVTLYCLAR